jgi:hypothetical protein
MRPKICTFVTVFIRAPQDRNADMKKLLSSLLAMVPWIVCAQNTAPTMGWSSWNTYRVNISDTLICHQADCMVSTGLKAAGYTYINIDDGFQGGRGSNGVLRTNPHRFPRGLKPVVDYIHNQGLKAGIYSDAGSSTCGYHYDNDSLSYNVGFYRHDQQDANLFFRELGFDFVKVDFCGGRAKTGIDGVDMDEQERYTAIRQAIYATGRRDVRMNVCRWAYPGTWVSSVADSWRTTQDIRPRWSSVRNILEQNLYLSAYSSDGHYNDMDMLEVGRGMTIEEDKTHFGMWCMLESPLLIGCDLGKIDAQTLSLLKNPELIALNQAQPHQQAYLAGKSDSCFILVKDVESLYGLKRAVAFYNPTDKEATATLRFGDVDLGGAVSVRSVFMREEVGVFKGNMMRVVVPKHGCRIYVLTGEKRVDRSRYEAETGYIKAYQELWNNQSRKTGIYEYDDQCSSGAKATWLGCSAENALEWKNVHVRKSGKYYLLIACKSTEERSFSVVVNDKKIGTYTVSTDGEVIVKVKLRAGNNTVRLSNDTDWMPDIDYMDVAKHDKS